MKILTSIIISFMLLVSNGCNEDIPEYPKQFFKLESEFQINSNIFYYDSAGLISNNHEESRYLFDSIDWGETDQVTFSYPWINFLGEDTANLVSGFDRIGYDVIKSEESIAMFNDQDTLEGEIIYWGKKRSEILFSRGGYLIIPLYGNDSKAQAKFGLFNLEKQLKQLGSGELLFTRTDFTYVHGLSQE